MDKVEIFARVLSIAISLALAPFNIVIAFLASIGVEVLEYLIIRKFRKSPCLSCPYRK